MQRQLVAMESEVRHKDRFVPYLKWLRGFLRFREGGDDHCADRMGRQLTPRSGPITGKFHLSGGMPKFDDSGGHHDAIAGIKRLQEIDRLVGPKQPLVFAASF